MSVAAYLDYKDTGVEGLGRVPSHWTLKRLRFAATLNPTKAEIAHLDRDTELSFLPMDAVGEDGSLRLDELRPVGAVETGYTFFREGDVTFAKITPCFENGKGAIMRGLVGGYGFGTTELTVLRPVPGVASAEFLNWIICSPQFRAFGEGSMYGAGGQKRVPDDFARDFVAGFPSVPEQAVIANFLHGETGKIDALVEEQWRLIALLKKKRQAVISHAVTKGLDPNAPTKDSGIKWLAEVPAHWEVVKFIRLVHIAEGQVDPRLEPYASQILIAPNHIESGTGRIINLETAAEQNAESGKYQVRQGDVVYSKIRPALAKSALSPIDGLCSADMYPLRSRGKILEAYLNLFILSPAFTAWSELESERVAMPKINREKLNEVYLTLPPITEQRTIVNVVDSHTDRLDQLLDQCACAIALLAERRAAIISAAVTGKIDLRGMAYQLLEVA